MTNGPEELKYVDRLNISVMNIGEIKTLIMESISNTINCWNLGMDIPKQTFRIVGPAGVGKTEICYQIAQELSELLNKMFECMVVKCPVLSRDDFLIPFPIVDNGNTKFKMLYSDFIPFEEDSWGIYVIDEFSRGDHNLQQLMWQMQNEYKIHMRDLPKGWFVVTIDNPDDQEYSMDNLEDAAGLRRMLHIYVEVSPPEFINHAIKMNFHRGVIEFIQAHPDFLYDFQAQKLGSVYANPASYERLSNILWGYEKKSENGIKENLKWIEYLASGLLNVSMSRKFIEFPKDMKDINPRDIFFNYDKIRPQITDLKNKNDNAKLGEIMVGFMTFMTTSRPLPQDKECENIILFLTDMPIDTAALFITMIDNYERRTPEFKYLTKIHVKLMPDERYRTDFYEEVDKLAQSGASNG